MNCGLRIPYFVSVKANTYLHTNHVVQEGDAVVAFVDVILHVGAWVVALLLDLLIIINDGNNFVAVAKTTLWASVACTIAAGTTVIGLWLIFLCGYEMDFLPASLTSLITGNARTSAVLGVLTASLVATQLLLEEVVAEYSPSNTVSLHVLRMLILSVSVKLFGVACTVNNHRLENNDKARAAN